MKKMLAVLSVALLGALVSSLALAGSTVLGSPQTLGWTRTGTSTPPSSYQDTITIVSAADSVRTSNINTRNWDWGVARSTAAATSPVAVAKIEVWTDPGVTTLVGGDSLGFCIEPSFDGGNTYVANNYAKALAYGASLAGNSIQMALQNGALYGGTAGAYGWGYLCVDPDGAPIVGTTVNFYPFLFTDFRLKVFGDAGAIGPLHIRIIPLKTL